MTLDGLTNYIDLGTNTINVGGDSTVNNGFSFETYVKNDSITLDTITVNTGHTGKTNRSAANLETNQIPEANIGMSSMYSVTINYFNWTSNNSYYYENTTLNYAAAIRYISNREFILQLASQSTQHTWAESGGGRSEFYVWEITYNLSNNILKAELPILYTYGGSGTSPAHTHITNTGSTYNNLGSWSVASWYYNTTHNNSSYDARYQFVYMPQNITFNISKKLPAIYLMSLGDDNNKKLELTLDPTPKLSLTNSGNTNSVTSSSELSKNELTPSAFVFVSWISGIIASGVARPVSVTGSSPVLRIVM